MSGEEAFAPGRFEASIASRAAQSGIDSTADVLKTIATHARAILAANERLHLTTIVEPEEFLERHIGEALEGARALPVDIRGTHVDIGSGNGYPAIPFTIVRPLLRTYMVEASQKKSEYLRHTVAACGLAQRVEVIERHVQRAADLPEVGAVDVLTIRAVGGWSRLVPKLAPLLAPEGVALVWCGEDVERVRQREAWRKLQLVEARKLPALDRAFLWIFRRSSAAGEVGASRSA